MSQLGGSGRRRVMAMLAMVLMLCVAAPELGMVAGASTPTPAGTEVSSPSGKVVLVARRRSRAAIRRARVRAYLRSHPAKAVKKINAHPGLYARQLRKKGIPAKAPKQARAKVKRHKARQVKVSKKVKRRRAAVAAKKKQQRKRRVAAVAAARRKKANKAKKSSGSSLGFIDFLEIGLLILAPFAAVALLLYITDVRRRPRAPSRTKRRRSLVITPLNKG